MAKGHFIGCGIGDQAVLGLPTLADVWKDNNKGQFCAAERIITQNKNVAIILSISVFIQNL